MLLFHIKWLRNLYQGLVVVKVFDDTPMLQATESSKHSAYWVTGSLPFIYLAWLCVLEILEEHNHSDISRRQEVMRISHQGWTCVFFPPFPFAPFFWSENSRVIYIHPIDNFII